MDWFRFSLSTTKISNTALQGDGRKFTFVNNGECNFFSRLYDALAALELSDESCEQLINSYKHDGAVVFKVKLQKFGIYTLEPDTVLELIRNRI